MVVLVPMNTFCSGLQLEMQSSNQQISQQTGAKQVSLGGAKLRGADQVSEIPTIISTAHKRGSSESVVPKAKVHYVEWRLF